MMKLIRIFSLPFIAFLLLTGCTVTHEYGPYSGKVVDAETSEPIAGAVVFLRFYTEGYSLAGFIPKYADALEVMTDRNGEFNIPTQRITRFRIPHRWDPHVHVVIFKPGYGCYPWHMGTTSRPQYKPKWTLLADKHVTIILPQLKTVEERKRNLGGIHSGTTVPDEKKKNLLRLESDERVNIGLSPYPAHRYGGDEDER